MALLFTITGKHISISEDVKKHAEQKTSRLPRYYDNINQVEVIINGGEGTNVVVEIIARAEHSKVFVVKEAGEDVYQCVDVAAHKLERQLRRKKEKERNNKHTGA